MPLLTLAQLRTPVTRDEARTLLISELSDLGFASTSWQSSSVQRTFLELGAWIYSTLTDVVATAVTVGFGELTEGAALTEFSESHYDNTRNAAVAAQQEIELTCSPVTGPYAIAIGELVVSDGTETFRNVTALNLASGATDTLICEAEAAGSDGNAALGTITTMVTPLAGVSCDNTALLVLGEDSEDDDSLEARNRTKWATLSIETPNAGYEWIARDAVTNCRVLVDDANPRGQGTVDVYIAADDGIASGPEVAAVQSALAARILGARSMGTTLIITYAAAAAACNFTFDVYYDAAYDPAVVKAAVDDALTAYIDEAPIGGYDYTPGPANVLAYNDIVTAIRTVDGVRAVVMTAPAADVVVAATDVATVGSLPAVGSYHAS